MKNVTTERMAALADELAQLSKRQSDALQNAAYFRMTREEAAEYDERRTRIGELSALLGKYKA